MLFLPFDIIEYIAKIIIELLYPSIEKDVSDLTENILTSRQPLEEKIINKLS